MDRLCTKSYVEEGRNCSTWNKKSLPLLQIRLLYLVSLHAWVYSSSPANQIEIIHLAVLPICCYHTANEKVFRHYWWLVVTFPSNTSSKSKTWWEAFSGFWMPVQSFWKLSCHLTVLEGRHPPIMKLDWFIVYSLLNIRLWRTADFFHSYMHTPNFRKGFTLLACFTTPLFLL